MSEISVKLWPYIATIFLVIKRQVLPDYYDIIYDPTRALTLRQACTISNYYCYDLSFQWKQSEDETRADSRLQIMEATKWHRDITCCILPEPGRNFIWRGDASSTRIYVSERHCKSGAGFDQSRFLFSINRYQHGVSHFDFRVVWIMYLGCVISLNINLR